MMWSQRIGDEVYVFRNGKVVYKRWCTAKTPKKKIQPSYLFNEVWPNEQIV